MNILDFITNKKEVKYGEVKNKSVPGICFLCTVKNNSKHSLKITAKNNGQIPVLVWVSDKNNKQLHFSHSNKITNHKSTINVNFIPGNHQQLNIGLSFLNPLVDKSLNSSLDGSFELYDFSVTQTSDISENISKFTIVKESKEENSEYYNKVYETSTHYKKKVTDMTGNHHKLWVSCLEEFDKSECCNIFDIGCGPGHLAELFIENKTKIKNYWGYDFSSTAISMSKEKTKGNEHFIFEESDIFEVSFDKNRNNETYYVCFEFLEHIDKDIDVIKRIPSKSKFMFSVPNFWCKGHVRIFENEKSVRNRYENYVDIKNIKIFKHGEFVHYFCVGTIK